VTNRVKQRQQAAQTAAGIPSKRERRELGRKAAAARAASIRRRRFAKNAGTVLAALAVVGVIVWVTVLTSGSTPDTSTASTAGTATGSPTPITAPTDKALNTKPTVTKGTGDLTALKVTTLIAGTGPAVTAGETISVNYVGVNYKTGEEFDSSWKNGAPVSFPIGTGGVIEGWDQGLVGVKIGSRVQLDIPSSLAYPNTTSGPTSGPLRFVVDVLSATPAA
jgi:peptidylprolyl isomerase